MITHLERNSTIKTKVVRSKRNKECCYSKNNQKNCRKKDCNCSIEEKLNRYLCLIEIVFENTKLSSKKNLKFFLVFISIDMRKKILYFWRIKILYFCRINKRKLRIIKDQFEQSIVNKNLYSIKNFFAIFLFFLSYFCC